jgi:DNA-binding LacI/PurR family transcriptional regulator
MTAIRPTMKTVAAKAGVSVMTVSRALRNQPNLPESTRQRIQKIALEIGYRPNPMVSTLMAQLRGSRPRKDNPSICFVTAYPDPGHWKDLPYNVEAFQGALARAEELGYRLEHFCVTEPGMTFERASRILRTQGISGLLIAPLPEPSPKLNLRWEWFCCADIGASLKEPVLNRAIVDHFATMRLTYRSLRDLGYRRIGLALRPMDDNVVDNKWLAGYITEQFFTAMEHRVPVLLEKEWTEKTFSRWYMKNRPDAVITMHHDIKKWLENMGIRVPLDAGVAMPDLSFRNLHSDLSGVDQHTKLVGSIAVDLVVEQINHNQRGIPIIPKVVTIQGTWVSGRNVRAQNAAVQPKMAKSR